MAHQIENYNIKAELPSSAEQHILINSVKIEKGISANDIKIVFDNGLLYCEHCEAYYEDYCIECGMLVHILNRNVPDNSDNCTQEELPNDILEIQHLFGQFGILASKIIPEGVKFGPFTGLSRTERAWKIKRGKFVVDEDKSGHLNWMQYINPAKNISEGNLIVFQCEDYLYYRSTRQIQCGEELLVCFGEEFEDKLNENVEVDFIPTAEQIKDVFACTFCSLGFSSKSYLAKHQTICLKDSELTQCSFCKIHLGDKKYLEHHLTYCSERNVRKCILPTSPAKQGTAALNARKGYPRQIYRCEQCNYRTKFQADLKEHAKQHYEAKMYKCAICNRRYKTKESLRLHMEKTHAYAGGKDDQEHSSTDHINTYIKVEQSRDQNKIFKCLLCVYHTKQKPHLERHIKTKHLKEFDFKCDKCEYGTNEKSHLERHIKTKHLKEFDFKCGSCELGTNTKHHLERHIKTKHLKEYDYKCDKCEYCTNQKSHLERHIKTKHLKEFDFKCGSCEFRTNSKYNLEKHIKTKHLKKFDYKCNL